MKLITDYEPLLTTTNINNLPVIFGAGPDGLQLQVVELFPGLLETLREPAMLLYDMMYFTSQAISWSLGRTWVEV